MSTSLNIRERFYYRFDLNNGPIVTKSVEKPCAMYIVRLDKGDASEINVA
jgi:hypothetical protein